jgi:peptide/nickel transport system permease protein
MTTVTTPSSDMAKVTAPSSLPSRRAWLFDWLRRDKRAAVSLTFLVLLVLISVAAPWLAPHSPTDQDLANTLVGPSAAHWLGTDDLGRDIFSRLLYGARVAIYASALAVGIAIVLGVPVGIVAGYSGGWIDDVIGRMIDTFLSFPAIVLAIAVTGALGIGLTNGMIAVGIVFAPQLARLARARTLVVRQELYVDAARCFGASTSHILWRHILPNALQPVIVQVTILLAAALLAEASLSFLGLGIQPPNPSWGAMLARAYQSMEMAPDQMYAPGLAILATALAFNSLGEALRKELDPTNARL